MGQALQFLSIDFQQRQLKWIRCVLIYTPVAHPQRPDLNVIHSQVKIRSCYDRNLLKVLLLSVHFLGVQLNNLSWAIYPFLQRLNYQCRLMELLEIESEESYNCIVHYEHYQLASIEMKMETIASEASPCSKLGESR